MVEPETGVAFPGAGVDCERPPSRMRPGTLRPLPRARELGCGCKAKGGEGVSDEHGGRTKAVVCCAGSRVLLLAIRQTVQRSPSAAAKRRLASKAAQAARSYASFQRG